MLKTIRKLALASAFFIAALSPAQTIEESTVVHLPTEIVRELRCLELNLHHEARGEPISGIIAVANVTINRTKHKNFPDTICEVVKQPRQFSWVKSDIEKSTVKVAEHIRDIAYRALLSTQWKDNTKGALYFHNTTVDNFNRPFTVKIGGHIFYR